MSVLFAELSVPARTGQRLDPEEHAPGRWRGPGGGDR